MQNAINNVKFFAAGNAKVTVSNDKGEHYTYRIRKPDETKPHFVSLLTGRDNENSFTYMGIFNPSSLTVRTTAKSSYREDSKPVKVLQWAIRRIAEGKPVPEGYAIQHEGKCCRCGRTLTTPESIERGIGPECAGKLGF